MKKILLILLLFTYLFTTTSYIDNKTETNNKTDSALNERNVYLSLLALNIKYPEVVMSQIMIESSYLKSKLCIRNNNLLGMTVASKRKTTAINTKGYAKYASWIESVLDYKLYQDYIFSKNNLDTKKKYIAYLQKNYAKSKGYKKSLINLSKVYELRNSCYIGGI